jgi:hypothetical protein
VFKFSLCLIVKIDIDLWFYAVFFLLPKPWVITGYVKCDLLLSSDLDGVSCVLQALAVGARVSSLTYPLFRRLGGYHCQSETFRFDVDLLLLFWW